MKQVTQDQLYISRNGSMHAIGPDNPGMRAYHEALISEDYASCHPGDSIEGLKRRARFTKEDKGLLMEWMARASVKADKIRIEGQSSLTRFGGSKMGSPVSCAIL